MAAGSEAQVFLPPQPSTNPVVAVSMDGVNWNTGIRAPGRGEFRGIVFAQDLFVAVGARHFTDVGDPSILLNKIVIDTSPDGQTWTMHPLETTAELRNVGFGNGLFLAVGDEGTIVSSTNGTNWVQQSSPTTLPLRDPAYGSRFVIVGGNRVNGVSTNVILTSPTGTDWTPHPGVTVGSPLIAVAYGRGTFVALAEDSRVLTSSDEVSWTPHALLAGVGTIADVTYGGGSFLAVGDSILSSADGVQWTFRSRASEQVLRETVFGNGSFLSVGTDGAIVQSGAIVNFPPDQLELLSGGGLSVAIESPPRTELILETSSDLKSWSASPVLSNGSGVIRWSDPDSAFPQRFYRLKTAR